MVLTSVLVPVVPHKAVAEVLMIGDNRRDEVVMDGWQSESIDAQLLDVV